MPFPPAIPPKGGVTPQPGPSPGTKRVRVAVACERCKTRKQKCDGRHPSCSNCATSSSKCAYTARPPPQTIRRKRHVKALEARIALLESYLTKHGLPDIGDDIIDPDSLPASVKIPQSDLDNEGTIQVAESVASERRRDSESGNEEQVSMMDVLRQLSLEASGGYIGASSTITLGQMVKFMVKDESVSKDNPASSQDDANNHLLSLGDPTPEDSLSEMDHSLLDGIVVDKLVHGFLKYVTHRMPIMFTPGIWRKHSRRFQLQNSYQRSTLYMIYALGAKALENAGEGVDYAAEAYYQAAINLLEEVLEYNDIRSVTLLLLLALYCLGDPRSPGAWTYVGIAMRICIQLGFHRRSAATTSIGIDAELRKRVFWSCYGLDRQISILLGRPFTLSDRDIDCPLPFDVDLSEQDKVVLAQAAKLAQAGLQAAPSTSMSGFIHITRLRRLESEIQQSIYRVDESWRSDESSIDRLLVKLEDWKAKIPAYSQNIIGSETVTFNGRDSFILHYNKALRLLLYPLLTAQNVDIRYVKMCAEACGSICETYKRLYHCMPGVFSHSALQSVFYAGLTVLYCIWISPQEVLDINTNDNLNSCSIVLYVITERWPEAQRYRDAFEKTKRITLDLVAEGKHRPRRQVNKQVETKLRSTLEEVDINGPGKDEVLRMISDMAGDDDAAWEPLTDEARMEAFEGMDLTVLTESGDWSPIGGIGVTAEGGVELINQYSVTAGDQVWGADGRLFF